MKITKYYPFLMLLARTITMVLLYWTVIRPLNVKMTSYMMSYVINDPPAFYFAFLEIIYIASFLIVGATVLKSLYDDDLKLLERSKIESNQ